MLSLITGPLVSYAGLPAAGLFAALVAAVPLLMALSVRISGARRVATKQA